jgi:murein peptide amidase A
MMDDRRMEPQSMTRPMTPKPNTLVHFERWKKTSLGNPIELFASHSFDELRSLKPILLMGGIHGDEPEGVRLATETLAWLKSQSSEDVAPWICVPCLNVDGFAKGERQNANGVDLNRNYPSKSWTPKFEKERYFPGPSAASELEIQAVIELIRDFKPRLLIHCHSYHPCIVGAGPRSKLDSQRLSDSSGYKVMEEIGYPTPGSLSQYGWHDLQIPVICIEEDDQNPNLNEIWPRFEKGMAEVFLDKSMRDS